MAKNIKSEDPGNGRRAGRAPRIVRSAEIGPAVYPEIERQLLAVELCESLGDRDLSEVNDAKFMEVLNRFLVDEATARSFNEGRLSCSDFCLDESKHHFIDTARFALANCVHASHHL